MAEMEEKLGAILGNPQMMQQIMSIAQALNQSTESQPRPEPQPKQEVSTPALPNMDPAMLQKLAGLAGQGSIDRNQQALLKALGPYLSRSRIQKLEKAMRAARLATAASSFLTQGGISLLTGR